VSLTTRKGQAAAAAARERARQAAEQIGPAAKGARENAAVRIHGARKWAAPRIEQAAQTVQENVAPKVSAALEATAQRIQPAPQELKKLGRQARRRARMASQEVTARQRKILARTQKPAPRWPKVMGGLAFAMAIGGALAAIVMRRGRSSDQTDLDDAVPGSPASTDEARSAPAEAEAGSDGQVRTS